MVTGGAGRFVNIDDLCVAGVILGFVAGDALQLVSDVPHACDLCGEFVNIGVGVVAVQFHGHQFGVTGNRLQGLVEFVADGPGNL